MSDSIAALRLWYEEQARPFLQQHEADKVVELDRDLHRLLRTDQRASDDLAICFLGAAGVGKSTLINALVAGHESLVPAGGIGPLTALAMQVRFGEIPAFEAEYQSQQNLWRLVFGLEQSFKRLQAAVPPAPAAEEPSPVLDLSESAEDDVDLEADSESGETRFDALRRQAQKLVTDSQDGHSPIPYLLDRLREVCDRRPIWGTQADPNDASRVERLRGALASAKEGHRHRATQDDDRTAFLRDLAEHATGFLAPLIRELNVYWNAPLLELGVTLVDLPGIGVAGDVYKTLTRKWIVEKAKAVVLVVDNRGVKEPDAELLRQSDFLTRLLFSIDDPKEDPVVLIAAVTQLDSPALDRFYQDRSKRKREHLADVSTDVARLVKGQMRQQLLSAWSSDGQIARSSQERIVDSVVEHLRVFPVSAFEFRRFLRRDVDDTSFISEAAQSGVPQMLEGLAEIAKSWREHATQHRDEATKTFVERVATTLELVEARWQHDARAGEEAEALRRDLEIVIRPMRDEFLVRKGEFRGFLRNEIPRRIEALVSDAAQEANKAIRTYLRGLKDYRWNTLKAAVTRDGVFTGSRCINLPDDFSQMFVEPIAEVWGDRLLQEIRKRTRAFTDDCIGQLETLVEWCRAQGTRVQPKLLEKHVASIKADTKQVNLVGKEALSNLREDIKNRLKATIEKPIRRRCQDFVRKGLHENPGVKRRILEMFDELSNDVTADARDFTVDVLTSGFKNVEKELRDVTRSFENPLEPAADTITAAYEDRLKHSDAQKRKGVLEAARQVIDACPSPRSAATASGHQAA